MARTWKHDQKIKTRWKDKNETKYENQACNWCHFWWCHGATNYWWYTEQHWRHQRHQLTQYILSLLFIKMRLAFCAHPHLSWGCASQIMHILALHEDLLPQIMHIFTFMKMYLAFYAHPCVLCTSLRFMHILVLYAQSWHSGFSNFSTSLSCTGTAGTMENLGIVISSLQVLCSSKVC